MPYNTALKGQVKLGGAAFDLKADLPSYGGVVLAGSNSSPLSFQDAIANLLNLTGSSLELPSDFPHLPFERNAVQITVSSVGVLLSGTSTARWKDPFGVLNGLTLHTFELKYS